MTNYSFMHTVYADGEKLTKMQCAYSELLEKVKNDQMCVIGPDMDLVTLGRVLDEDQYIKVLELICQCLDENINQFNFNMNGYLEIFKKDKGAE